MEQRRSDIVALVNQKGSISFSQLKEAFPNVSEMTLRTDLKALDQARRLVRVHGGAKSVDLVVGTDDLLGRRMNRNADAKRVIAQKAARLLHPNTTVFLDSGSTATALAGCVPDEPFLIYTSGLSCAAELARLTRAQVYLPGGALNRFSLSVCGMDGIRELAHVNFDLVFLGVTTYSADAGFCCGSAEECRLKRSVLRRAEQTVVLLDSAKLGLKSSFSICGLDEVQAVVSDGGLPEDFLAACARYGVTVY